MDRLEHCLASVSQVVFLCSGNMVRSAFAELYALHGGFPLPVRSLATVYRNAGLYPETARALADRGVPLERCSAFRPTHVDDALDELEPRAVLFGMRPHHLEPLAARPELAQRAFLLGEVLGQGGPEAEIGDPVLEGADFDRTFERVARCVDRLRERLASA